MQSRYKYTNLLIHESSPYLQQHAHNPVNWMPWGEAAFARAREEDKPLLVSIGYSTCHWCHVMEAEVFSDEEAAAVLNNTVIAVKVDREERPDIDQIYMAVCQMMTGNGGWPLNIFMTPEKKPFYAATYIPKHSSYGRTGIMELAEQIYEIWRTGRSNITRITDSITKALDRSAGRKQAGKWDDAIPDAACSKLEDEFDTVYGGFGTAPKFPQPQHLLFLLRYRKSGSSHRALQMVKETLLALRRGGIYDHVGGGFHRYATDRMWLVPHFEKMLYDQALLLLAYTEAWQVTAEPVFRRTAEAVINYVSRDMTSPEGGFYTAEDADSAGKEGRFYLWTYEELAGILDKQQWECFTGHFPVTPEGNFAEEATGNRNGLNILYLAPASDRDDRQPADNSSLDGILQRLFAVRQQRIHPFKDDKILADWNGLMLAALATAARVFADPACLSLAVRNARFILEHLQTNEGDLLHSWRRGKAALSGYITDYAFFAWGLIELYQTGFETEILKHAVRITGRMIALFHDAEAGGFYITANNSEEMLFRQKEYADNALPSGNSIALLVLLKLSRITGSTRYEELARKLVESTADMLHTYPHAFSQLLCAGDFLAGNTCEIVITATRSEAAPFLEALNTLYFPGRVVVLKEPQDREIDELTTYTRFYRQTDGKPAVFVCRSFQCSRPVHTVDEMLQLLQTVPGRN